MSDCVRHLDDQREQMALLQAELASKSDVCVKQQEEITSLMGKVIAYESRLKKAMGENEDLLRHLEASEDVQRHLTQQVRNPSSDWLASTKE